MSRQHAGLDSKSHLHNVSPFSSRFSVVLFASFLLETGSFLLCTSMSRPGVFPWKTIRHLHHTTEIRTNCNHAKANGFLRHYVKKVMTHRRRSSVQYVPAKKHQDCKSYGTESNTSLHLSLHILLLHPGAGGVILLNCLWKSIRTKIVARH